MHSNFHGRYSSYVWWGPKNITSSGWRKICFFISMWFMFWNLRVLSTRLVSFFPKKLHHPRSSSENWAGEMGGSPSFTRSGACCSKIFTKCCLRAAFPMAKRHNRRRKAYFLGTSLHQHVEKLIRSIEWISLVDKRATTRWKIFGEQENLHGITEHYLYQVYLIVESLYNLWKGCWLEMVPVLLFAHWF